MNTYDIESLDRYLHGPFLMREDWVPERPTVIGMYRQPHYTSRSDGHFIFLDGEGKPAMRNCIMDRLSGMPYGAVVIAIGYVRESDPDAIIVLEWSQRSKSRRPTRYQLAMDLGMDHTNITRKKQSAVRQVYGHLHEAMLEYEGVSRRYV